MGIDDKLVSFFAPLWRLIHVGLLNMLGRLFGFPDAKGRRELDKVFAG
jgi:hypothetical protein